MARVVNGRGEILVSDLRIADNFFTRLRGLLFSRPLQHGQGLLISGTNGVHTMMMRYSIRVVYLNKKNEVVYVRDMQPWAIGRIIWDVRSVLEVPFEPNTPGFLVGETLVVES